MSDSMSTTTNPAEIIAIATDSADAARAAKHAALKAGRDALAVAAAALEAARLAMEAANFAAYGQSLAGVREAEQVVAKALAPFASR